MALMCTVALVAQPKVVAHRGYWKAEGSAQNSVTSLTKAASIGAYASEFDVWLTADNKLVVNHDALFKGVDMAASKGRQATAVVLDNGESLPTLDQYLKAACRFPDTKLVFELKSLNSDEREALAVKKSLKLIRKYHLEDRTCYISFSLNACDEFVRQAPKGSRVYYLNGELEPAELLKHGFAGMDYSKKVLRTHPEWVAECRELGLESNVWTVDSDEDLRYFVGQGVDYITTNYPELLQSIIAEQ